MIFPGASQNDLSHRRRAAVVGNEDVDYDGDGGDEDLPLGLLDGSLLEVMGPGIFVSQLEVDYCQVLKAFGEIY